MRIAWHVSGGGAAALLFFIALQAQQAEPCRIATVDARLYAEACVACHGDGGHGGGPTLVGGLPLETIVAVSQAGRNSMPAFGRVYTEADLRDVATYVTDVLAK